MPRTPNRYANLNFSLNVYKPNNEDETCKEIRFEGHEGWQQIQFSGEKPTPRELELVTKLSECLDALAKGE